MIEYRGARGVVYRIKYADVDGKQVMETVGAERDGVTRRQAEAELRERLVRVERKHYRRPKALTFAEWAATWLEEGNRRRGWKPQTVQAYVHRLVHLNGYFGPTRLGSIRPRDVAGYIRTALGKRSARTVIAEINLLHDVLSRAVAEELIHSNPAVGVERPKAKPTRWRILEPDEVRSVASAFVDERAQAVFLTLHLTGIRRHEIQALQWQDVSLTEGTLRVVESKSEEGERLIALAPLLVGVLTDRYRVSPFKADGDYVFAHPETGARLDRERYAVLLRQALAVAEIRDRDRIRPFHDARHAALTHLALTPGASELVLMATAGHRSFATTQRYLHLAGRAFPEAAAALEDRLLAGRKFYPTEPTSPDLSEPETANHAASDPSLEG